MHRFVLLLTFLLLIPAQAAAQGEVKSKHGDWDLRCDTPAGSTTQQCVIMQFVTAQDRENVGLSVVVMKTADKQARILRVLAPLGVLLPRGLGLRIDNTDMGTTGFIRCLPNGCVSEVLMDDQLIQQLRNRQAGDVHHLPDAGRRHRRADFACRIRRRVRRSSLSLRLPPDGVPGVEDGDRHA